MIGSEMAPYSKTGGLGDVMGALPGALARLGCEVTVVVPFLPSMDRARWGIADSGVDVRARLDGAWRTARVLETRISGYRVLFLHYPPYFDRDGLYGTAFGDHGDNAQRFAFFAYAAVEAARQRAPLPDVVHVHDWQAALIPLLLRAPEHYGRFGDLSRAATVLTVHNLSYQGVFPKEALPKLGISWAHFRLEELEFWDQINFLKAGLTAADAITTVSPTYAQEIQTPEQGWGLDGVLRERAGVLHGVLNGIDRDAWDPGADPLIPAAFTARTLCRRTENADALRQELKLPPDGGPIVGVVSRLAEQKGIELVLGLSDRLRGLGLQWAILGSGDARYEKALRALARRHPKVVGAKVGFDERIARLIYAGSDFFCMPSLFEPCGLGQLIALRYGSVPIVRSTGGLADTVRDLDEPGGVGIVFGPATSEALEGALVRARDLAAQPEEFLDVRKRGMGLDFSWEASAREYLRIYGVHAPP